MKWKCENSNHLTCLYIDQNLLNQVTETCLMEVKIKDDLKWHKNTARQEHHASQP